MMNKPLYYFLFLASYVMVLPSHAQVISKSNLEKYSKSVIDLSIKHGVNINIDSSQWGGWISQDKLIKENAIEKLSNFLSLTNEYNKGDNRSYSRATQLLGEINENCLYDTLKSFSRLFIPFIRKEIFNNKYTKNYLPDLLEIMGTLELSKNLTDSIINSAKVPIHVKARLGDKRSEDLLIREFRNEIYDTVYYDKPKPGTVRRLLYANTKGSIIEISNALKSKRVYYMPLESGDMPEGCNRWQINSINEFILAEYFTYFNHEITKLFKTLSYSKIEEYTYEKFETTNNKTELKDLLSIAVVVYSKLMSDFLSEKYNIHFAIEYKQNVLEYGNRLEPPPSKLKDNRYMDCLIKVLWGEDIINEFPLEYESYKAKTIQALNEFYQKQ